MGLNVSPSFIFGGDTGVDYAELKRRRKLADALKEQAVGATPRNVPEGIAAIGKALIYKATDKKLSAKERKAREEARKAMAALLGGGSTGAPAGVQPDYTGGAPADLVARVMQQESGGDPNAVSPKGAVGTMQTMPGTLVDPGFGVRPAADPNDPAERERVGKDYLAAMLKRYNGDETRALVAYNWGPGNADKWDGDPAKLPAETRNYVQAILGGQQAPQQQQPSTAAIMQVLNNPYATPEQRSIAQAMLAQSMQKPEQMTPYQREQIRLREQELKMREAGTYAPGTTVNTTVNTGEMSPAQKAIDTEFAKEVYTPWVLQGQSADSEKLINQLAETSGVLASGKNVTGPVVGAIPDIVNAWVNPESIAARERVEEVVQRNLKNILGGQFTEREGAQLIKRAYNPILSEEENKKRVDALIKQMVKAAEAKAAAVKYFDENGTLRGFKGKLPSMADFAFPEWDKQGQQETVSGQEAAMPKQYSSFEEFSQDEGVIAAAKRAGVTPKDMWEIYKGGDK